jgi:hypothetical protein
VPLHAGRASRSFYSRSIVASLYTPRWSAELPMVQLGFMVRVRDPRVPHGYRERLPGERRVRRPAWRWLKVYVGWTNRDRRDERGAVLLAEIETHITDGALARTTYKTYARVKLAKGAARRS